MLYREWKYLPFLFLYYKKIVIKWLIVFLRKIKIYQIQNYIELKTQSDAKIYL